MITYFLHFVFICINGVCPAVKENDMTVAFFGHGNSINKQLLKCSHQYAQLKKSATYKYNFLTDDVPEAGEAVSEALRVLREKHADLSQVYHHTFTIVPQRAIEKQIVAYAGLGGTNIVAGDNLESSMSIFMHEFGHNLGLNHATFGIKEYGDNTGYMGTSSNVVGGPMKCYNAYNFYYLGWYQQNFREIPMNSRPREYIIYSFPEVVGDDPVIFKYKDLFFLYNKAISFNKDTGMYKNNLVFVRPYRKTGTQLLGSLNSTSSTFKYKDATFSLCKNKTIDNSKPYAVFCFKSDSYKAALDSDNSTIANGRFDEFDDTMIQLSIF